MEGDILEEVISIINEYIKSELLVIVPVLYVIAKLLDASKLSNRLIPGILMAISLLLAGIYTFGTVDTSSIHKFLLALFSTLIQGVLLSGSAIFSGILTQLLTSPKDEKSNI